MESRWRSRHSHQCICIASHRRRCRWCRIDCSGRRRCSWHRPSICDPIAPGTCRGHPCFGTRSGTDPCDTPDTHCSPRPWCGNRICRPNAAPHWQWQIHACCWPQNAPPSGRAAAASPSASAGTRSAWSRSSHCIDWCACTPAYSRHSMPSARRPAPSVASAPQWWAVASSSRALHCAQQLKRVRNRLAVASRANL